MVRGERFPGSYITRPKNGFPESNERDARGTGRAFHRVELQTLKTHPRASIKRGRQGRHCRDWAEGRGVAPRSSPTDPRQGLTTVAQQEGGSPTSRAGQEAGERVAPGRRSRPAEAEPESVTPPLQRFAKFPPRRNCGTPEPLPEVVPPPLPPPGRSRSGRSPAGKRNPRGSAIYARGNCGTNHHPH